MTCILLFAQLSVPYKVCNNLKYPGIQAKPRRKIIFMRHVSTDRCSGGCWRSADRFLLQVLTYPRATSVRTRGKIDAQRSKILTAWIVVWFALVVYATCSDLRRDLATYG